jgi:hypothetical protein
MHDDARRQDDAKKKRMNNSNIRDFFESLHSTPLTRDLAPRSTIRRRKSWVNYRIFMHRIDPHDTMMIFRRMNLLG